jgi:polyisoprenoid-binding protein YceI
MRIQLSLVSALLFTSTAAFAQATVWEIDPSHSSAQFAVRHMMVSTVRGDFGKMTGQVKMNGKDMKLSLVDAIIDTTSINTRDAKRDGHLKSPDFLDVTKYPAMTFKSKKIEAGAHGIWKLLGDLTIHGVTKPVTFDVQPLSAEAKDPWGNTRVGTTASAKINRKDFGLTWNAALETGGVVVGDEVNLTLDVELVKKK